jgi:hypothetical protein
VFAIAAPVASVMVGCFASPAHAGVIDVPNYSFETPTVSPYPALLTSPPWYMNGYGTVYEPFGPGTGTVAAGVGIFTNPSGSSVGHLTGADGNQLAYLFSNDGNGISQALVNPGNTTQATVFTAGQSYTLTAAAANATAQPGPSAQLFLDLYYVDGGGQHNVAQTVLSPSQLSGTAVTDFSVSTALLAANNPAVGQQLNVGFFTSGTGGGEFDIDNVRITSTTPEPTSLGLLGLGAAALMARCRTDRR